MLHLHCHSFYLHCPHIPKIQLGRPVSIHERMYLRSCIIKYVLGAGVERPTCDNCLFVIQLITVTAADCDSLVEWILSN